MTRYAYESCKFTHVSGSCSLREALPFERLFLHKIVGVMARTFPVHGKVGLLELRESQLGGQMVEKNWTIQ